VPQPACAPQIYFTTDGSDPVVPVGGAAPTPPTLLFTGPIALASTPGAMTTTTVKFQGVGSGGNVSGIQTQAFTVDLLPPTVGITAQPPALSNSANPSFTFTANKAGTTFQCALDGAAPTPCTSPQSYPGLATGSHTFSVQTTDAFGRVSPPASASFALDTVPQVVSITARPPALSSNANPSFAFSASKAGTTFACTLDANPAVPCSSPAGFTGLTDGAHTFKVQGTDPAGNSGAASFAFTIATAAPSATGLIARVVSASEIDLSWTAATDLAGVAGYKIFRDGGTTPIGTVTSGTTFSDTGLAPASTHHYKLIAFDAVGNQSAPSTAVATTEAAATGTGTAPRTASGKPIVTVGVQRVIPHGTMVLVSVRTRPNADALITVRLTRQSARCTGAAPHRVCASVTTVLAQRVVRARANRQGLLTQRVALGYAPAKTLRATLAVRVATRYGTVTRAAVVVLKPAPRSQQG
jgi:hypothetical protein